MNAYSTWTEAGPLGNRNFGIITNLLTFIVLTVTEDRFHTYLRKNMSHYSGQGLDLSIASLN
jgi:hypothetical protein